MNGLYSSSLLLYLICIKYFPVTGAVIYYSYLIDTFCSDCSTTIYNFQQLTLAQGNNLCGNFIIFL